MSFIWTFLIFVSIDLVATFILSLLGFPMFTIDILVNFILSFLFAYLRRDRSKSPFYKDLEFHRNFATIFIVLLAFTYVIGYIL